MSKVNGVTLSFILMFIAGPAGSAVTISATPLDSTSSIRLQQGFSRDTGKKDVRLRVSSTDGKQYQVFQRVLGPMVNERGETLDLAAVETAGVAGSNGSGALSLQRIDRLSMGDQLVYTSSSGGQSDSFIVAYALRPELLTSGGAFSGQVMYSIRSIGDGGQAQATLNLFVDSVSSFNVDVVGARSPDRVVVRDSDTTADSADMAKVIFSGGSGSELRIYQQVVKLPVNKAGQEIGIGTLRFIASAGEASMSMPTKEGDALAPQRQLIYSGNDSDGRVLVRFLTEADKIAGQDAGDYLGELKYTVESDQAIRELTLALETRVQPLFMMDIEMPPEGMGFKNVLPQTPPQEKEVTVKVRSNMHRPYQVTQGMMAPLASRQGKEIAADHFTVKVIIPPGQKGRTRYTDFQPMVPGEYAVFSSDGKGSPATFKVLYRLQGDASFSPGDFEAPIRFSLDQN